MQSDNSFEKSKEFAFRRRMRRLARNSVMPHRQKEAMIALLNHWLDHRKSKGYLIHPGKYLLSRRAKVSTASVKRMVRFLRYVNVLIPHGHERGGTHDGKRMATEYELDADRFIWFCGLSKRDANIVWDGFNGHRAALAHKRGVKWPARGGVRLTPREDCRHEEITTNIVPFPIDRRNGHAG